jgi:hypothetical protein
MTIKMVLLKSGEDVIADVKELKHGETLLGYRLDRPVTVDLSSPDELYTEVTDTQVHFAPWCPLSADREIMIPRDWVISIVNPIEQIVEQYKQGLSGVGKAPDGYLADEDSTDDNTDNELEEQPDDNEGVDSEDAFEDESTGYYDPNEMLQGYTDEEGNPVDLIPESVEYDPEVGESESEWDGTEEEK